MGLAKVHDGLDRRLALLGIGTGFLVIVLSAAFSRRQEDLALVLVTSCTLYLVRRNRRPASPVSPVAAVPRALLPCVLFAVLLGVTALTSHFSSYERPLAYFLLVGCMAGILGWQCAVQPEGANAVFLIGGTLAVCFLVRWSAFYQLPTLMGTDTWSHSAAAHAIALTGNIQDGFSKAGYPDSKYIDFPILHLLLACAETVVGVSAKSAVFLSGVAAACTASIAVGAIAKRIIGMRVLAVAILFFGLADMVLVRTVTNLTPGAFVLGIGAVLLLVATRRRMTVSDWILAMLFIITIVLAHQLTTFALFLLLLGTWAGSRRWPAIHCRNTTNSVEPGGFVISGYAVLVLGLVITIAWLFHNPTESSFGAQMIGRLWRALNDPLISPSESPYVTALGQYSLASTTLYHAGYLVLVFLGTVGVLNLLHPRQRTARTRALITGMLLVLAMTYLSPLTGLKQAMIPHRFLPIAYLSLAVVASAGMLWLSSQVARRRSRAILSGMVLATYAFLMVTTPFLAWDTPYERERASRTGYTASEVAAARFACQYGQLPIATDSAYGKALSFGSATATTNAVVRFQIDSPRTLFTSKGRALLIRELVTTQSTLIEGAGTFGSGRYTLIGPLPLAYMAADVSLHRTYTNGQAYLYVPRVTEE